MERPFSRIAITYALFSVQLLFFLFFTPIIYRELPADDYAVYGVALASFVLIQIITLGYSQNYIRLIVGSRNGNNNYTLQSLYSSIAVSTLISCFLLLVLASSLMFFRQEIDAIPIIFFITYFVIFTICEFGHSILLGFDRFSLSRLIRASEILTLIFCSLILYLYFSVTLASISIIYLIASLTHLIVMFFILIKVIGFRVSLYEFNLKIIFAEWYPSRWYLFGGVISFMLLSADAYLISSILGLAVFAMFQPMMKMADVIRTVVTQIPATFFSTVSQMYNENRYSELKSMFKKLYFLFSFAGLVIIMLSYLWGRNLLEFWLGTTISEQQNLFFIMCIILSAVYIVDSVPGTFSGAIGLHVRTNKIAIAQVAVKFLIIGVLMLFGNLSPIMIIFSGVFAFMLTNFYYTPIVVLRDLRLAIKKKSVHENFTPK